ncbi:hypothetical protein B2G47_12470 [Leptospira interrogans serovar Canicola]|nr:hypothetical protein B2G47_12470 [Leptospira interrogans serovar Canicola]
MSPSKKPIILDLTQFREDFYIFKKLPVNFGTISRVRVVSLYKNAKTLYYRTVLEVIRIVEKLILHLFLFYGNGQLKQFC